MSKKHVFLSYCHDDSDTVRKLRDDLVRQGEPVWWDEDILPGQNWKQAIRRAMKDAYAVVVCLSRSIANREKSGVFPELRDAIGEYRLYPPGSIFLIPVRLDDCDVPDLEIDATTTLDGLQYVDLFPPSRRADGLKRLVRALAAASGRATRDGGVGAAVPVGDSAVSTSGDEDVLAVKRRRLAVLRKKEAYKGVDTEPHVLMEIEDLEKEIARLEGRTDSPS